jgi:hypothetical protein
VASPRPAQQDRDGRSLQASRAIEGSRPLTDKRLGVTTTNRNWNTTTKLLALAGD